MGERKREAEIEEGWREKEVVREREREDGLRGRERE